MRRKPGLLLPLEESILAAATDFLRHGTEEFHGFLLAKEIQEKQEARLLTAHGTLYKALERLEREGLLTSRWENPQKAADAGHLRRRLYRLTAAGNRITLIERSRLTKMPLRQGVVEA